MNTWTHNLVIGAILTHCMLISSLGSATPQRVVVGDDGKMYSGKRVTTNTHTRLTCDNISATIMAHKLDNLPPNIMATIAIQSGSQKQSFRLFNIAEEALNVEHDLSTMKVGCLTRNGGVGINISHLTSDELGLKIQIDAKGRVFLGYDQVGLELFTLPKK